MVTGTRVAPAPHRPAVSVPPADPSVDRPADLGWALTTLLRGYIRAVDVVLADLPGGGRAYRLLASVAHEQMPTQLALAESAGLDRTVVTYLVDDLVAAGLVERRPDPADRRARRIVLTDLGRDRLADFERRLHQVELHLLAPLGEADTVQLRELLDRAANALRHSDPTSCAHIAALAQSGCGGPADAAEVADAGEPCSPAVNSPGRPAG